MVETELQRIIDGCIEYDRKSQELLYKELYGFAMKICLRYADNRYEASEVLNEGFFKAFTNIDKYDKSRPFLSWLSKIMYNASIDYYRTNLKWTQFVGLEKSTMKINEPAVEHKLDYEDLLSMIQHLPPAYRIVFNLYAVDGYSHEEIAEMTGISAGTSRSNLYKARQKLQQMISVAQSVIILLVMKLKIASIDRRAGINSRKLLDIMTSRNFEDIDKLFREGLNPEGEPVTFQESDWSKLKKRLDWNEKKKRGIFWLSRLSGVAALVLLFFVLRMLMPEVQKQTIHQAEVQQKEQKLKEEQNQPKVSRKIKKWFTKSNQTQVNGWPKTST